MNRRPRPSSSTACSSTYKFEGPQRHSAAPRKLRCSPSDAWEGLPRPSRRSFCPERGTPPSRLLRWRGASSVVTPWCPRRRQSPRRVTARRMRPCEAPKSRWTRQTVPHQCLDCAWRIPAARFRPSRANGTSTLRTRSALRPSPRHSPHPHALRRQKLLRKHRLRHRHRRRRRTKSVTTQLPRRLIGECTPKRRAFPKGEPLPAGRRSESAPRQRGQRRQRRVGHSTRAWC